MKIKAIAALCKKSKCVFLIDKLGDEYTTQWAGDGKALYPLINIPYVETDNLCAIFEYTTKQQEDFMIRHTNLPTHISLEDTDPTEKMLQKENISISYDGRLLKPLHTSKGIVFIDCKYFSPLSDILSSMELYERINTSGQAYIVAKVGFLLFAVIMPYDALNETFVMAIERLSKESRIAFDRKEREKAEYTRNEPKQQTMDYQGNTVDAITGEIIETGEVNQNENSI
jgi:hypothetical protein